MDRKGRFVSYKLWVFDRQTKIINQAETEFIMCINHGHYLLISFININQYYRRIYSDKYVE